MDLQSRLVELSSVRGLGALFFWDPCRTRGRRFSWPHRVHFPRAERFDRRRGGHKPSGKVGLTLSSGLDCYRPGWPAVAEPRNDRIDLGGYLSFLGSSTVGDWVTVPDDCSLGLVGLAGVLCSGSEASLSAFHPTRLETRTKESNMPASH